MKTFRVARSVFLKFGGVLALIFMTAPPAALASEDLTWSISPYIWATDTKVDLKARGVPIGSGSISFGDLLDATDASFQGVVEGRKGRWSAFVDLTHLETSDRTARQLFDIKTESEVLVLDAAVAFWPAGEDDGLSVFAGIRYTDLQDKYRFRLNGTQLAVVQNNRDFTDILLGARYIMPLSERWSFLTRGDYSFGDSQDTFQLQALVRWGFGARHQHGVLAGYRYKEADFKSGGVEEDYQYKGPAIGLNFTF
ncbi:MAG: hypothetical protein R3E86_14700 [Pseudomonadales bacterium]